MLLSFRGHANVVHWRGGPGLKQFSNGFGEPGCLDVWVRRTAQLCDKIVAQSRFRNRSEALILNSTFASFEGDLAVVRPICGLAPAVPCGRRIPNRPKSCVHSWPPAGALRPLVCAFRDRRRWA